MITINGKEYRNLQEQVLENMDEIESLKNKEADDLLATGIAAGQVLTANGNGGTEWAPGSGTEEAVQAPTALVSGNIVVGTTGGDRNVATLAAGALGDVLTQGAGAPTWTPLNVEGENVKSTGVTSGKVLTADGNGGAEWAAGASGDVTASGTLSVGSVMVGLGGKLITALNGSNGKILGWNGGAVWQDPPKVYVHNLIINATDENENLYSFGDHIYSTQSTALVTDISSFVEYVKKTADLINQRQGITIYGKSVPIIVNGPQKIDITVMVQGDTVMTMLILSELSVNSTQKAVWAQTTMGTLTTLTAIDNISEI